MCVCNMATCSCNTFFSYLFFVKMHKNTKSKNTCGIFVVFCIFPLLPKMHFVFLLYFSIPSQIALCPFDSFYIFFVL